jgi:hypothetical protein
MAFAPAFQGLMRDGKAGRMDRKQQGLFYLRG